MECRQIDVRRIPRNAEGLAMMRLAIAANDMASCRRLFSRVKSIYPDEALTNSLGRYLIRLQIAHLGEAMARVNSYGECGVFYDIAMNHEPLVRRYLPRLLKDAVTGYQVLSECLQDLLKPKGQETDRARAFRQRVLSIRNKSVFHYDARVCGSALERFATQTRRPYRLMQGNDRDRLTDHFEFAEAVLDRMILDPLWGIDPSQESNVQEAADEVAVWCEQHARHFLAFAIELCWLYFDDRART